MKTTFKDAFGWGNINPTKEGKNARGGHPIFFFMVRYRWSDKFFPDIQLRQIEVFGNLQVR